MKKNLFVRTLKNRIVSIAILALIFGIASICYNIMWVRPVYEVDSKILVSSKDGNTNSTQIETVKSYIKSRSFLRNIKVELSLRENTEELAKKIKLSENGSQIIKIQVKDTVVRRARDIADQISDEVSKNVVTDELQVSILEYSTSPMMPISPNIVRDTLISYFAGIIISFIIFMIVESKDDVMRENTSIEDLNVKLIGDIPYIDERSAIIDEG